MAALTGWPAVSDDSGTGQDGTVLDSTFFDAIKASIEAEIVSSSNPSETVEGIIDEVVDARGSQASLDARLDVALNEDGTLKTQASLATLSQLGQQIGAVNLLQNDDFVIWELGNSLAPSGWSLTNLTVARTGTGLGDTNRKVNDFAVKLTRAATDGNLQQELVNSSELARSDFLKSTVISGGCWVKSSTPNAARIAVTDGATTTFSSYHTGGGAWEWLTVTHTVSNSATNIAVQLTVYNTSSDAYFSGVTAVMSDVAPTQWQPCPKVYGTIVFRRAGTLAVANALDQFAAARPIFIKDVALRVETAPTGAALIVDIKKYDTGAAGWVSMFSTLPQIAAAAFSGTAQPDGTYSYRCIGGGDADSNSDELIRMDITQVGSSVAGANLWCWVRAFQYARPLESLLQHDHWGA